MLPAAASLPASLGRAVRQLADPAILRVLAKTVIVTLLVFAALGVGAFSLLDAMLARWAGDLSGELAALVAVLAVGIGGWLLFRIVALAVLQFYAEDIVRAVERRYYPDAAETARSVPLREGLADGMRSAVRALAINLLVLPIALVLLVTGIGTVALFFVVNAWLLGRELRDLAWLRHRHDRSQTAPVGGGTRFLLGGAIAALLAIPFVNLLAPVIGAAAATHLVQSGRARARNPMG
jgi:uncharacterized protein involved in cysteine biosynthesis